MSPCGSPTRPGRSSSWRRTRPGTSVTVSVGTEHLLLGLLTEGEGVAASALESLGISLEEARDRVEEIVGRGQGAPAGHIPFTPRAKKVLEGSLREALQLGHTYIGTEHLLLSLLAEGDRTPSSGAGQARRQLRPGPGTGGGPADRPA